MEKEIEQLCHFYWPLVNRYIDECLPFLSLKKDPNAGFMYDERIAIMGLSKKTENIVIVNVASIDFAYHRKEPLHIAQFIAHELRHIYQYQAITDYKNGVCDYEPKERVERWSNEFDNYVFPVSEQSDNDPRYYEQDIEFDAYVFSYALVTYKAGAVPYLKMPKAYEGKYDALVEEWYRRFKSEGL